MQKHTHETLPFGWILPFIPTGKNIFFFFLNILKCHSVFCRCFVFLFKGIIIITLSFTNNKIKFLAIVCGVETSFCKTFLHLLLWGGDGVSHVRSGVLELQLDPPPRVQGRGTLRCWQHVGWGQCSWLSLSALLELKPQLYLKTPRR